MKAAQPYGIFLRQLQREGTTILLTSHYLEEVDALAGRVAIIDSGQVISSGTPAALKAEVGGDRITLRIREFTPDAEATSARDLLTHLPVVQEVIINSAQGNSLKPSCQPRRRCTHCGSNRLKSSQPPHLWHLPIPTQPR